MPAAEPREDTRARRVGLPEVGGELYRLVGEGESARRRLLGLIGHARERLLGEDPRLRVRPVVAKRARLGGRSRLADEVERRVERLHGLLGLVADRAVDAGLEETRRDVARGRLEPLDRLVHVLGEDRVLGLRADEAGRVRLELRRLVEVALPLLDPLWVVGRDVDARAEDEPRGVDALHLGAAVGLELLHPGLVRLELRERERALDELARRDGLARRLERLAVVAERERLLARDERLRDDRRLAVELLHDAVLLGLGLVLGGRRLGPVEVPRDATAGERDQGDDAERDERPEALLPQAPLEPLPPAGRTGRDRLRPKERLHVVGELLRRLVALARVLLERLEADGLDLLRELRLDPRGRRRVVVQDPVVELDGRLPHEGETARDELVHDHAEGVDVRAAVHILRVPARLLGREVVGRPHDGARLGEDALVVLRLGEPEVGELRVHVVVDEDVRGLQVAVDDPVLVRVMDAATELLEDLHAELEVELLLEELVERLPVHVLHREEGEALVLARVEEADDARVVQLPRRVHLAREALLLLLARLRRVEHELERRLLPARLVLGEVDDAHAAAADLALDRPLADGLGRSVRLGARGGRILGERRLVVRHLRLPESASLG